MEAAEQNVVNVKLIKDKLEKMNAIKNPSTVILAKTLSEAHGFKKRNIKLEVVRNTVQNDSVADKRRNKILRDLNDFKTSVDS